MDRTVVVANPQAILVSSLSDDRLDVPVITIGGPLRYICTKKDLWALKAQIDAWQKGNRERGGAEVEPQKGLAQHG